MHTNVSNPLMRPKRGYMILLLFVYKKPIAAVVLFPKPDSRPTKICREFCHYNTDPNPVKAEQVDRLHHKWENRQPRPDPSAIAAIAASPSLHHPETSLSSDYKHPCTWGQPSLPASRFSRGEAKLIPFHRYRGCPPGKADNV